MNTKIQELPLPGLLLIEPHRHFDERGYFSENYSRRALASAKVDIEFVQDNLSLSTKSKTVRGLHFQLLPFAQTKLVQVLSGRIIDVAVDIRKSSPTFGRHVCVELSAESGEQILVPAGFAHGFCTLEPNTQVLYKVDNYYSAEHEGGVFWCDPAIGIRWPVSQEEVILSEKDRKLPLLADAQSF